MRQRQIATIEISARAELVTSTSGTSSLVLTSVLTLF